MELYLHFFIILWCVERQLYLSCLFYVTFRLLLEDCLEITNSGCYEEINRVILYCLFVTPDVLRVLDAGCVVTGSIL